jgi:hypothetical protein
MAGAVVAALTLGCSTSVTSGAAPGSGGDAPTSSATSMISQATGAGGASSSSTTTGGGAGGGLVGGGPCVDHDPYYFGLWGELDGAPVRDCPDSVSQTFGGGDYPTEISLPSSEGPDDTIALFAPSSGAQFDQSGEVLLRLPASAPTPRGFVVGDARPDPTLYPGLRDFAEEITPTSALGACPGGEPLDGAITGAPDPTGYAPTRVTSTLDGAAFDTATAFAYEPLNPDGSGALTGDVYLRVDDGGVRAWVGVDGVASFAFVSLGAGDPGALYCAASASVTPDGTLTMSGFTKAAAADAAHAATGELHVWDAVFIPHRAR